MASACMEEESLINTKNYWSNAIISWTDQHLNANVSGNAQDWAWYEIKSVMRCNQHRRGSNIMWDKVFGEKRYQCFFND